MPREITINGNVHELPNQGENAPWGEELSDLIYDLSSVVNSIVVPGDVATIDKAVQNTETSIMWQLTPVLYSKIEVNYLIRRTTDTLEVSESGKLTAYYDDRLVDPWVGNLIKLGDASITFNINSSDELTYTTTPITGANHDGLISYDIKVLAKAS